jgi:hypothetical protein
MYSIVVSAIPTNIHQTGAELGFPINSRDFDKIATAVGRLSGSSLALKKCYVPECCKGKMEQVAEGLHKLSEECFTICFKNSRELCQMASSRMRAIEGMAKGTLGLINAAAAVQGTEEEEYRRKIGLAEKLMNRKTNILKKLLDEIESHAENLQTLHNFMKQVQGLVLDFVTSSDDAIQSEIKHLVEETHKKGCMMLEQGNYPEQDILQRWDAAVAANDKWQKASILFVCLIYDEAEKRGWQSGVIMTSDIVHDEYRLSNEGPNVVHKVDNKYSKRGRGMIFMTPSDALRGVETEILQLQGISLKLKSYFEEVGEKVEKVATIKGDEDLKLAIVGVERILKKVQESQRSINHLLIESAASQLKTLELH